MTNLSNKEERLQNRQKTSIKNFRYNRFLMLRYFLALFFFANLYWFLALLVMNAVLFVVPAGLMLISVLAIAEHVKLYGETSDNVEKNLRFNLFYHYMQIFINLICMLIVLTGIGYSQVFPFLNNFFQARALIFSVLILGSLLSFACVRRINHIKKNTDKHFEYIKDFENSM